MIEQSLTPSCRLAVYRLNNFLTLYNISEVLQVILECCSPCSLALHISVQEGKIPLMHREIDGRSRP